MVEYIIPLSKMNEVYKRVDTANRRLVKAQSSELFTIEEKQENIKYKDGFVQIVHVTVNSPSISAGDYEFLASVEILEGGTILNAISTVNTDDLPRPTEHTCEYCGTKRSRKHSYLLRNNTTGEISHIGKSCLEVFTGVKPSLWTLEFDLEEYVVNPDSYDEYVTQMYNVRDIIRASYVASNGGKNYISQDKARDKGISTTSEIVEIMINDSHSHHDNEEIVTLINKAKLVSDETIDEVINTLDEVEGEFGEKLRVISKSENIIPKYFKLAVAIVSAYNNTNYRKAKAEEAKKDKALLTQETLRTQIQFPPKTKIKNTPVKVIRTSTYEKESYNYGTDLVALNVFADVHGNHYIWHSTSDKAFNLEVGDNVELNAIIKSHNVFNNKIQIVITRAKMNKTENNQLNK